MSKFDLIIDRRGTSCAKWDYLENDNIIPLTCADMDLRTSDAISECISKLAGHNILGYTLENESLAASVSHWYKKIHDTRVENEWVVFCPRVLTGINLVLDILCNANESVVVFSPWYDHLPQSVLNNNLQLIDNPLVFDGNRFVIDFNLLEEQMDFALKKGNRISALILTNPHNPTGRVWEKEELERLVNLCERYDCYIVSDDIHSDITYGESSYHSLLQFNRFNERFVLFNSPAKTFNVAGAHTSYGIIPSQKIRDDLKKKLKMVMVHAPNAFALEILNQAYNNSDDWYSELLAYLEGNLKYLENFVSSRLHIFDFNKTEGTYLAWMHYDISEKEMIAILKESDVNLIMGEEFGEIGKGYVRLNFACPRNLLEEALLRIEKSMYRILQADKLI